MMRIASDLILFRCLIRSQRSRFYGNFQFDRRRP